MSRENKRKQYEKGMHKTHPCDEVFTCKVCGRQVVPAGAGTKPASGQRARGPGGPLRRDYGAGGGVGARGRRMGRHPPLPPVRRPFVQPGGGGRQPPEADEHCHEAPVPAALSPGAPGGDDRPDGGPGQPAQVTKAQLPKDAGEKISPAFSFRRPRRNFWGAPHPPPLTGGTFVCYTIPILHGKGELSMKQNRWFCRTAPGVPCP